MTGPAVKDVKDTVTQMGLGLDFEPLDLPLVILVVLIINCSYLSLLRDLVLLIRAISTFGVNVPGQSLARYYLNVTDMDDFDEEGARLWWGY